MSLAWSHTPGSPVPFRTRCRTYSVGTNYQGLYRALFHGCLTATPLGEPTADPLAARAIAEQHHAETVGKVKG